MSGDQLERYCEIIAAMKVRTTNKKGRRLSTVHAIELMEEFGVETPEGLVKPSAGLLTRTTVNRYLRYWGYDEIRPDITTHENRVDTIFMRLTDNGSARIITGPSQLIWVESHIMWVGHRPQSHGVRAEIGDELGSRAG